NKSESSHDSTLEQHGKQIEEILNHLDESPLDRIERIKDDVEGLDKGVNIVKKVAKSDLDSDSSIRPKGEALRKCILSGPYKPTTILVQALDATNDSPPVPEHTTVETPMNMSLENKAHFLAEKETIHLILTRIGDDIYSTVDACQTTQETNNTNWMKFFDILKKYQNEVNELRAETLARNANPLALVATAQADRYQYYQTSRSHRSQAPSLKPSILTRSHTYTRHKGKEIAKPITPPSETAFEEDNDPEQAQMDKDITSSNSKNKNVDMTPRFKNDNQSGQFKNQRTVNVAAARENVGRSKVVHQSGIQCFNCREFRHFAKECRKLKRVKDSAYHKEKMLLCKQAEQGVPLQAEQYDWLVDTDEEVDEQELEAHYSYMAKIQEAVFEKYKAFNDRTVDYDKLKLKFSEALRQLAQKDTVIREGLKTKAYEISVVKQKHDELMKQSLLTKSNYEGLVKQKTKVITDLKLREEHDIEKMLSMEKQLNLQKKSTNPNHSHDGTHGTNI
nr:hypothetical protein [Tanacetum cinerariifolium]